MERLNIIWIIIIEIILTAYAELPTPWELLRRVGILLSVYQIHLCGHSNCHQVMDQKSSFFICPRVSARFLHCFCTVSRDAMGTLTCKIRQRVQKLHSEKSRCFAQKQRKLETFKIRVTCPVGSFNQRARDSSSLERTKRTINRWDKRFVVFFVLYWLFGLVPMIFSKILEVRGTKMKKIQKNAARFDNLKQDFLDDPQMHWNTVKPTTIAAVALKKPAFTCCGTPL